MDVIRHILYATDFSPAAGAAWPLAQSLAEKAGATLSVLHVMLQVPEDFRIPAAIRDAMRVEIRARAEDAYAGLTRWTTLSSDRVALVLVTGVPAAEIVLHARAREVDLIVMGTHGYAGLTRWLLGSVAQHVIRTASCPVLTVRPVGEEMAEERGAA